MTTTLAERLLAAALLGSLLGATGCSSTTAQTESTMPAGEKASCKGQHGCSGQGQPGESAGGVVSHGGGDGATGEKASCKGQHGCSSQGQPGESAGGVQGE